MAACFAIDRAAADRSTAVEPTALRLTSRCADDPLRKADARRGGAAAVARRARRHDAHPRPAGEGVRGRVRRLHRRARTRSPPPPAWPRCTSPTCPSSSARATRCSCPRRRTWRWRTPSRPAAPSRCSSTPSRAPATSTSTSSRASSPTRTRAISVVHYLGLPVDMERVLEIARRQRPVRGRGLRDRARRPVQGRPHVGLHRRHRLLLVLSGQAHHHRRGRHGHHRPATTSPTASPSSARSGSTRACSPTAATPAPTRSSTLGLNYRLGEVGAAIGVEQMKRLPGFLDAARAQLRRCSPRASREIDELTRARDRARRRPALAATTASSPCSTTPLARAPRGDHRPAEGRGRGDQRLLSEAAAGHALLPRDLRLRAAVHVRRRRRSATARSRSRSGRTSRKVTWRRSSRPSKRVLAEVAVRG